MIGWLMLQIFICGVLVAMSWGLVMLQQVAFEVEARERALLYTLGLVFLPALAFILGKNL